MKNKIKVLSFFIKEKGSSYLTVYGMNRALRSYLDFPKYIPLWCHYEHGIYLPEDPVYSGDIDNSEYLILTLNSARAELWKNVKKLPVVISGSPFVNFRQKNKIEINNDAKGTLVFPAHSCEGMEQVYNIEKYCDLLQALPEKFKPITISLHIDDIKRGKDKIYKRRGFNIFCTGEMYDRDFAHKFYQNLQKYKYATSNTIGSYVFYAVEMGLPFFLMGEDPQTKIEEGTKEIPRGQYSFKNYYPYRDLVSLLPKEPVNSITDELKDYVEFAVGVKEKVTPQQLKFILIKTFLMNLPLYYPRLLIKTIKNKIDKRKNRKKDSERRNNEITMEERVKIWFANDGDNTLRLDYDLNENSIVFDVGGYEGNWTNDIFNKYHSNVYIFEPVKSYFNVIKNKFANNEKICINHFGLSNTSKSEFIYLNSDESSVIHKSQHQEKIELVNISSYIIDNKIENIDLMKINIEGGEYDLLTHLIETGLVSKIKNIQVQFHDFVDNAEQRMYDIQKKLSETHEITYQYEFVWENWKLKENV